MSLLVGVSRQAHFQKSVFYQSRLILQHMSSCSIQRGQTLPDAKLMTIDATNPNDDKACSTPIAVNMHDLTKGKNVVLFAVPGAFTPLCSSSHLPEFVAAADEIKKKGIDTIACLATNDAFVMHAWGKANNALGKVMMLADGNADYAKQLGSSQDLGSRGMGTRFQRLAMIVRDGKVEYVGVDSKGLDQSSAAAILKNL